MPLTRDQINDVKVIIRETISELLKDDKFISIIADNVDKKLGLKENQQKVEMLNNEIEILKQRNADLQGEIDEMKQHMKRKSLRIHGIKESSDENVQQKVVSVRNEKLNIEIDEHSFEHCFRVGKSKHGKRSVLVSVKQQDLKYQILQKRKLLKGSGIAVTEDMTSAKYELYKMAIEKWGRDKVWFYGGDVRVKLDEMKHAIKSKREMDKLIVRLN